MSWWWWLTRALVYRTALSHRDASKVPDVIGLRAARVHCRRDGGAQSEGCMVELRLLRRTSCANLRTSNNTQDLSTVSMVRIGPISQEGAGSMDPLRQAGVFVGGAAHRSRKIAHWI